MIDLSKRVKLSRALATLGALRNARLLSVRVQERYQ